ncbi:MAG: VWA domain-containing protein, partial [Gammaproteobacteria bacterium]|nr:VWA domain-containing protein [Gammaproteobacteria bacterium]
MKRLSLVLVALVAIISLNGQELIGNLSEVAPIFLNPEDGGAMVFQPRSVSDEEPVFLSGMTEEEYIDLWVAWKERTGAGEFSTSSVTRGAAFNAQRVVTDSCTDCSGCDSYTVVNNDQLTAECQSSLNMVLIIDESGSISGSEVALVDSGVTAFLADLSCTDASIAIIEFGTNADYVVDTYTPVADVQDGMEDYFDGVVNTSGNFTGQTYKDANYGTNWHAAMVLADNLSPRPDLVLFFTDGDPTMYCPIASQPLTSYSTCGSGTSTQPPEIYNPVMVANSMKEEGTHMFILGVGTIGSSSISRIQAISGTTAFNSAGSGDAANVATADYAITSNFNDMQASLQEFVANLCPFLTSCDPTHTCDGSSDGTITVDFADDATTPFFVSLDGATAIETSSSSYTFTGLSAGSYTITASESSGCTREAECTAVILNSPAMTLSDSHEDVICAPGGGSATGSINLSVSGGTSPFTYSWSNSATTQDISGLSAATYSVTVTDALDCTASRSVTIDDNSDAPGASASGGTITCSSSTVQLLGSSPTSGVSYSWTGPGGFTSSSQNPTVSSTGTYTLTVTNTSTNCISTATAIVNQDMTAPGASASGGELTCSVTSITLNGGSPTSGVTYSWTGPGGFTSSSEDPSVSTPGTYNLTVTSNTNGCTSTATATVDEDIARPGATAEGGELTCLVLSITLDGGTTTQNAVSYSWTGPGGFTSSAEDPTVSVAGDYILTVTDDHSGCTSTATATVDEDIARPGATAEGGELTCLVLSITLDGGTTTQNAVSYSWTGPGGFTSSAEDPTVSVAGDYILTVTDDHSGCTSTATATVDEDIARPGATAEGGELTCLVLSITLDGGTTTQNAVSYSWTGPGGFTSSSEDPTVSVAGDYILTVTDDHSGCTSTATATVDEDIARPGATAEGGELTCLVLSITLDGGTTTQNAVSYSWTGPGGFTSSSEDPTVSVAGDYILTVTDDHSGCTSTATATVDEDIARPGATAEGG